MQDEAESSQERSGSKQEEYNAPVLLFDMLPCRIRQHRHASAAEEEQACFVDVYKQTHLGDSVFIKENLVGRCATSLP